MKNEATENNLTTGETIAIIQAQNENGDNDMARKRIGRGKNHSGNLVLRKSGIYEARVMFQGRLHSLNTHETDKRKAEKALAKFAASFQVDNQIEALNNIKAKIESENWKKEQAEKKNKKILMGDMIDAFLSRREVYDTTDSTKKLYRQYLGCLLAWFKKNHPYVSQMNQITVEMADSFLDCMMKETTENTYNQRLACYKRVWNLLGNDANCKENVFGKFTKRKIDKSRQRRLLTTDEVKRLISVLKNDNERLLFGLGIYTGCRISDCCLMKYGNVDLANNVLRIRPLKVKRHLTADIVVEIHPELRGLLEKVMQENHAADDYVMPDMARRYENGTMRDLLERIFSNAGIETSHRDEKGLKQIDTGFHALRVFFASWAYRTGMNPYTIKQILGHSDWKMSEHYLRGVNEKKLPTLFGNENEIEKPKSEEEEIMEMLSEVARENETPVETLKRLIEIARKNETKIDYGRLYRAA